MWKYRPVISLDNKAKNTKKLIVYWNTVNWKWANIKAMIIICILQQLQSAPLYSFKLNSV